MLRNLILAVLVTFCTASLTYAQSISCPGDLTVNVEGSTSANPLTITVDLTEPPCNTLSGDLDGEIDLIPVGGTPPYEFSWTMDGNALATSEDLSGLGTGVYAVTVTDDVGCEMTGSWSLTEPDPIQAVAEAVAPLCNGLSGAPTGYINLVLQGGDGNYSFNWTTLDGSGVVAGDQNQSELSAGTYDVTITDGENCTLVASYTLGEPDVVECSIDSPILSTVGGTNVACFGDTGVLTVSNPNGQAPFTYSLSGTDYEGNPITIGDQASNEFTVNAGTYTITSTDDNGCSTSCDYTLTQPEQLLAGTCTTDDECQVDAGEIEVEADGGVGPYDVTWTTSTTGATLDQGSQTIPAIGGSVIFTGAQGGATYIFTVTDANGCIIGG